MNLFLRSRRVVIATAVGLLLSSLAVTSVSAAPRPVTFDVFIGDYCIYGRAKNDSFLKVIITDRQGFQKGREAVEADPQGYWQSCTFLSAGPMMPGDTIKVTVFGTGQTRTFTVPTLTGRVDRGTNVVSGKAPAGTKVEVEAFDFRWDYWGESYDVIHTVTAAGGTFAYDFDNDGIDILGGAQVVVRWTNGSDTVHVGRFQIAPFVTLQLGRSDVAGAGRPNGHINIALNSPQANNVANAHGVGSYADTTFYGTFADADGEHYIVRGGEWLSAPALGAQSSWRIPQINAKTDLAADKVAGTCFPNGRFIALANNPNGFDYGIAFGNAAGNGNFAVDLTDQLNIRKGYRIAILCYSPGGDEIVGEFSAN